MSSQKKVSSSSNSPRTSTPHVENRYNGEENSIRQAAFIHQLQQQIQSLRKEHNEVAKKSSQLYDRISELEEEKVTISSNLNKENASLQAAFAQLEANHERGEASRQALEYELVVLRKKCQDLARSSTQREIKLSQENMILTDEKSSIELNLGEMENDLALARKVAADNEKRIAFLEDDKKTMQSNIVAAEALLRAENDKLYKQVEDLVYQNEQLKGKYEDTKQGLLKQEEDLRCAITDSQIFMEQEQRLRHELDEISHRAHSLEDCLEAERAAHLESKFNSEIMELKQQELRNQLTTKLEDFETIKKDVEDANRKIESLEKLLELEKQDTCKVQAKLDRTTQVSADNRKKLEEEITAKSRWLEDVTGKLNDSKQNVDQIKEELSKTKKKQITLEENYGSNVREIELLLDAFCVGGSSGKESKLKKKENNKSGKKSLVSHSQNVLEDLRKTLFAYQRRGEELEREVEKRMSSEQQALKDCSNFRDLLLAREKALQQTQQQLTQNSQQLENIRLQQVSYEREAGMTCHDLADVTNELHKQIEKCKQLEDNVDAIQIRHGNEVEVHVGLLRELHHVVCSASGETNTLNRFTWSDLSIALRESLDTLVNMFQRAKDKTKQLETSCEELQRSITELQRAHESSVDRLAHRCREIDEEAGRQRKQLEKHYEALLSEMHTRMQKTQTMCDETCERLRNNDGIHDGLSAECSQMRGENTNLLLDRKSLSCACAILFGALYPTIRARDDLVQQRYLLARINSDGEVCKKQMKILIDALNKEMAKSSQNDNLAVTPKSFRFIHPLIRFRVGVICVLAARRLKMFAEQGNIRMFTCNESALSNNRLIVVAGEEFKKTQQSKCKDGFSTKSRSEVAVEWLFNINMIRGVRDATHGLVEVASKNEQDTTGYMSRAVVKTAKNSFFKLMEATQCSFSHYVVHSQNIIRERTTLCRVLADGLGRVIHRANLKQVVDLFSVEHSFSALQRHLLSFTERLHAAEIEKRNLRNSASNLKVNFDELSKYKVELEENQQEIQKLKEKERKLVSRSRFDGVCSELNSALEREKKAQSLLHEQHDQLQDLSKQMESQCTEGAEKEITLTQAVANLSEVKMELKRCSHSKRQLEKQLDRLQEERNTLQNQVHEAKEALKRAAVEKTSITDYFQTVERTLQDADDIEISTKLREKGQEVAGKGGAGMKAAQRAIESFVRVQSSAVGRISNLESQIASYRSHISTLKRELHNICQRENENPHEFEKEFAEKPKRRSFSPSRIPVYRPSAPYESANEFNLLPGEVVNHMSYDSSPLRTHRTSEPTKDAVIRDLTNTYKST